MRLKVPITGKVTAFSVNKAKADGIGVSGDSDNPIRLIALNLGNVSLRLIAIDLETNEAEIEVTPEPVFFENTGQVNSDNKPIYRGRTATPQEKQTFLDIAKAKVEGKTKDQLYAETGSPKLKKLKKHVDDYKKYKADITKVKE